MERSGIRESGNPEFRECCPLLRYSAVFPDSAALHPGYRLEKAVSREATGFTGSRNNNARNARSPKRFDPAPENRNGKYSWGIGLSGMPLADTNPPFSVAAVGSIVTDHPERRRR